MRRTLSSLGLCLGLMVTAGQAQGLTLSRAISEGATQGPEAQVLKNSVDSANAKVESVKSVAYPHLSAYANAGLGQSPNASSAAMGGAFGAIAKTLENVNRSAGDSGKNLSPLEALSAMQNTDPYYSYGLGVQVTQPLFTFGKVSTALHMAKVQGEITPAQARAGQLEIQKQVVESWFGAYLAHARLELLSKSIDRQAETVRYLERNFAAGSGLKAELLMSRSRLITTRQELVAAKSGSTAARKMLNRLLGRPSEDTTSLDTTGISIFESASLPDRKALLASAYEKRQDLRSLKLTRTLMEDYAFIGKAAYYPTIAMQGKFGFTTASQNASAVKNTLDWDNRDWSIGIGMQWNLFDGWDNAGQTKQTRAAVRTMDVRLSDMQRGIEIAGETALSEKVVADSALSAAREGVEAAREGYELYSKNFNGGSGQLTDILSAEEQLRGAELGLLKARLDRVKSHIQISLVQGKDLISFGETP